MVFDAVTAATARGSDVLIVDTAGRLHTKTPLMDELQHAAITHPDNPIEHMDVREEKGLRPGGFGILMVRAKVDELIYNEKQNEVVFVKYLD